MNIIIFIILLIIMSFSIGLYFYKSFRIEETIPFTFIGIIIVLYLFGLFNLLKIGVYFICITSLLIWIYSLYKFVTSKKKKNILKEIFTPGVVIFVVLAIGLFIYNSGRMIFLWDEFSHWGDVVKSMFLYDGLGTNPELVVYSKTYFPGMSLFQYFFEVINGKFDEGILFTAYQVFAFSLFIPFFKNIKWKNIFKIVCSVVIMIFTVLIVYENFYRSIYIDAFLGITFGFVLALIYQSKGDLTKEYIIKISLGCALLIMSKDFGVILATICFGVLFVIKLINTIKNKKLKIKDYIPLFIIGLVMCFAYFSWQINISMHNIALGTEVVKGNVNIIDSLLGVGEGYGVVARNKFLTYLKDFPIFTKFLNLNSYSSLLLIAVFFYLIYKKDKDKNVLASNATFGISILGFVFYCLVLFVAYLTVFSEHEATVLASWERYIGTYFQGLITLVSMLIIHEKVDNKHINFNSLILIFILFMGIGFTCIKVLVNDDRTKVYETRNEYKDNTSIIKDKIGDKKIKLYLLSEGGELEDFWIARYEIKENLSGINYNYPSNVSDSELDPKEWMDMLTKEFDYVYVYKTDGKLKDRFGELFLDEDDVEDNSLFIIDKENRILIKV